MTAPYDLFRKYEVSANSVEDFLDRYYKHDRYKGRGEEYANVILSSNKKDFETLGICWMSRHESITGEIVAWYGK